MCLGRVKSCSKSVLTDSIERRSKSYLLRDEDTLAEEVLVDLLAVGLGDEHDGRLIGVCRVAGGLVVVGRCDNGEEFLLGVSECAAKGKAEARFAKT